MALINMNYDYQILAVYKEQTDYDRIKYSVAFQDPTGYQQYFIVTYTMDLLQSTNPASLLLESAYKAGGSGLAMALEHYIKWAGHGWDKKGFSVSHQYMKGEAPQIDIKVDDAKIYNNKYHAYKPVSWDAKPVADWTHLGSISEPVEWSISYDDIGGAITAKKITSGSITTKTVSSSSPHAAVSNLPGLMEKAKHPSCKAEGDYFTTCPEVGDRGYVKYLVMHLNDVHKWTREEIADWLETLDVDLRFKSPEELALEKKKKQLDDMKDVMLGFESKMKKAEEDMKMFAAAMEETAQKITQLQEELNGNED